MRLKRFSPLRLGVDLLQPLDAAGNAVVDHRIVVIAPGNDLDLHLFAGRLQLALKIAGLRRFDLNVGLAVKQEDRTLITLHVRGRRALDQEVDQPLHLPGKHAQLGWFGPLELVVDAVVADASCQRRFVRGRQRRHRAAELCPRRDAIASTSGACRAK